MTRSLATLPAFALALTANAQSSAPTCPAPPAVTTFRSLASLPAEVRDAITAQAKDIVDANQPFDSTDVVMYGAHFDRFAFAWHGNDRWIVATEHGGIAYSNPIYTITWPTPRASGTALAQYPARLVKTSASRPARLCTDLRRAFEEQLPAPPPSTPKSVTHS